MLHKLSIPGRLPGLNEYIEAERAHRQKGADLKRSVEHKLLLLIKSQLRGVKFAGPVVMRYFWYERDRRRDKDNVSSMGRKLVQDALVKGGVLPNDGWANVAGFTDEFILDKKNPRVLVLIEEVCDVEKL